MTAVSILQVLAMDLLHLHLSSEHVTPVLCLTLVHLSFEQSRVGYCGPCLVRW